MTKAVNEIALDQLDVSDNWRKKFDLMEGLGIKEMPFLKMLSGEKFKALPFKDRYGIMFNVWAMIFGAIYYIAKGMWKKGAVILGLSFILAAVLSIVETATGKVVPSVLYWIVPALFCAQFANRDFYAFKVQGESMWSPFPKVVSTSVGAILFPLLSLLLAVGVLASIGNGGFSEPLTCQSPTVLDTVKGIAKDEVAKSIPADKVADFDYQLSNVTQKTASENDGFSCSAMFSLIAGGSVLGQYPITFQVTQSAEGQTYVNVFGL